MVLLCHLTGLLWCEGSKEKTLVIRTGQRASLGVINSNSHVRYLVTYTYFLFQPIHISLWFSLLQHMSEKTQEQGGPRRQHCQKTHQSDIHCYNTVQVSQSHASSRGTSLRHSPHIRVLSICFALVASSSKQMQSMYKYLPRNKIQPFLLKMRFL
jgi:hypothetical protein